MIHLMPWPPIVVEIGFGVFCFLDILFAREAESRWLPRWGWVLAVLVFPIAGGIGWIAAGRHWQISRAGRRKAEPEVPSRPTGEGPDGKHRTWAHEPSAASLREAHRSDAELALQLSAINAEHEQTLIRWEQQLRHREAAIRRRELELQGRRGDR